MMRVAWLAVLLLACDDTGSGDPPPPDAAPPQDANLLACRDGERRCSPDNSAVEECARGGFAPIIQCARGFTCSGGECVDACVPDCVGRECGDDGCGGTCGPACADGWTCEDGVCAPPGCGDGACGAGEDCESCPNDCGCEAGESCVAGACTCTPDCGARVCGDDGCGGSCGECAEGACVDGRCEPAGPECGDQTCDPGESCGSCPVDCGFCCGDGTCEPGEAENCATCPADCACDGGEVCDFERRACAPECAPRCGDRDCGPDGCGGTCGGCAEGVCSAAGACVQAPEACGDGACGAGEDCATCPEDCGACCGDGACSEDAGENCATCAADCGCPDGDRCDAPTRTCVPLVCTPDCDGRRCGPDGCGGVCGRCGGGRLCNPVDGTCGFDCVPACGARECGDDGCGGSCGDCAPGEACGADGFCGICEPSCDGRTCGGDGCGGSCGDCDPGEACVDGACAACEPSCEGRVCGDDGCGGSCGECADGEPCVDGVCIADCAPDCEGRACGGDGCGGSCGGCDEGEACEAGVCVEQCVPACGGRDCGDDGCGGTCGACGDDERCAEDGRCVELCECTPGEVCVDVVCRAPHEVCGADNPSGVCPVGSICGGEAGCAPLEAEGLCDDANPCTADSYDVERDRCVFVGDDDLPCDDGDPCTADACAGGACVAVPIDGCGPAAPELDPVPSPTNQSSFLLRGAKAPDAAVAIDGELALPADGADRFVLQLELSPGENVFTVQTEEGGARSEARTVRVVYDPDPPSLLLSPAGGDFQQSLEVSVWASEPATVYFTDDGGTPDGDSPRWFHSIRRFRVFDEVTLRFRARDAAGNWSEVVEGRYSVGTARNGWTEQEPMPFRLAEAGWAALGDQLFVAGGADEVGPLAEVSVFSGEDAAWMNLPALPTPRVRMGLVAFAGGLIGFGGEDDGVVLADTLAIDPSRDPAWIVRAAMPTARHGMATAGVGAIAYAFGGRDQDGETLATAERYDLVSDEWEVLPEMPRPRYGAVAYAHEGLVYVFGGVDDEGAPVAEVDVYEPASAEWSEAAPMPTPRAFAVTGVVRNVGELSSDATPLVVAGGLGANGEPSVRVEAYDLVTDTWRVRAAMPRARSGAAALSLVVPGAVDTEDELLWVFGGDGGGGPSDDVVVYRDDRDYVQAAPPLPEPRLAHHAFPYRDRIYVFGGRSVELAEAGFAFDPETGSYDDMPPLPSAQNRAATVRLGSRFYLLGGVNRFGVELPTVRFFDAARGAWADHLPMPEARGDAAAAVHAGEIWVIGGVVRDQDANEVRTASVNVLEPQGAGWRAGPPLPEPRAGAVAASRGGALYVMGGLLANGSPAASVLRLAGDAWEVVPGADVRAAYAAGVRVGDDVLQLFGGRTDGGPLARSLEYDFRIQRAREGTPDFLPARDRLAVASYMGRLYLFGGNDQPEVGPEGTTEALSLDTRCYDGQEHEDGSPCGGSLLLEGPQVNLPHDQLRGWEICWSGEYSQSVSIAQAQGMCQGRYVMYACRPTGSAVWTLAAMGERDEVFVDRGNGNAALHTHNGVDWYQSASQSMGFVAAGTGVSRNSCDTANVAPQHRMCWHTSGGNITSGWRCGASTSIGGGWERAILTTR